MKSKKFHFWWRVFKNNGTGEPKKREQRRDPDVRRLIFPSELIAVMIEDIGEIKSRQLWHIKLRGISQGRAIDFIRPGNPNENAFAESLDRRLRERGGY